MKLKMSMKYSYLKYSKFYLRKPGTAVCRSFHTTLTQDAKKAVIFDMGGVILPSPFATAFSKIVFFLFLIKVFFKIIIFQSGRQRTIMRKVQFSPP